MEGLWLFFEVLLEFSDDRGFSGHSVLGTLL